MARSKNTAWFEVQLDGKAVSQLNRALSLFEEQHADFLREALAKSAHILTPEIKRRAKGSISNRVEYAGLKGTKAGVRAVITINHPGARSAEFGRRRWHVSPGAGNNRGTQKRAKGSMKRGKVVIRPGQKARPFLGVEKGDAAIGAKADEIRTLLTNAIEQEWIRLGGEGAT